ncbi:MAG: hypothetical protein II453_07195 [Alphaproteobacteria bacterium]|nr:hypothetical protein [Alphaproteobacteria bacterium]
MTTYYLEQDGQIKLHDTDKNRIQTTLKFMPQYAGLELKETERPIENCEWADTPEYIAKKHRQELESQVAGLEAQTGLIRPMRENILAEGSSYSDYTKQKAQEIEDLAQELREETEQTNEPELGPLED